MVTCFAAPRVRVRSDRPTMALARPTVTPPSPAQIPHCLTAIPTASLLLPLPIFLAVSSPGCLRTLPVVARMHDAVSRQPQALRCTCIHSPCGSIRAAAFPALFSVLGIILRSQVLTRYATWNPGPNALSWQTVTPPTREYTVWHG
ncbi:hypothetical protein DAEQUDRAFT_151746 [Daedalea quercina L-15889]|uniref:Uncharacterized protein n=1 Tax=Daedalea quercina L-15889 TaxID=1314783 RepID=A0A165RLE2_9APHY|nr:hypothetical protein DAEQUDRAFT_151746 [Daedalea quercina L-15889]